MEEIEKKAIEEDLSPPSQTEEQESINETEDKKAKRQKVWNVVDTVVTIVLLAITVVLLFSIIMMSTMQQENRNVFGYKMFTVLTDSMNDGTESGFAAGDIIVCKEVDVSTLKVGDIITYKSTQLGSTYRNQTVTHKITQVNKDVLGNYSFTVEGTNPSANMIPEEVSARYIYGKYTGTKFVGAGHFMQWLKTPTGYIVVVGIPFGALVVWMAIKFFKNLKEYKEERAIEIEEEQASELNQTKLENERMAQQQEQLALEKQKMEEELARMRAELEKAKAAQESSQNSDSAPQE